MTSHNLTLTDDELDLVLIGLRAISPSGGGSKPFNLYRKLAASLGGEVSERHEAKAQLVMLTELKTYIDENPDTTLDDLVYRAQVACGVIPASS